MAKVSRSQAFSKACVYYDSETARWKIEERDKDEVRVYDLVDDVLSQWSNVENVSISIKRDVDFAPMRGEED